MIHNRNEATIRRSSLFPLALAFLLAFADAGCKSIAGYDDVQAGDGPRDAAIYDGDVGTHDGDVPDGDFSLPDGAITYPTPSGPLVSEEGWQWEHPKTQGNAIGAFWGFGDDNIWAVGNRGVVLHFDGKNWSAEQVVRPAPDEPRPNLLGLWGASAADLWAVGEGGAIYHHGQDGWKEVDSPTGEPLRGVWGSSPTDVHVVGGNDFGQNDTIAWYRFDGSTWTSVLQGGSNEPGEALHAVWGTGPSEVWAVGNEPQAYQYDGTAITPHEVGIEKMRAIVGRSSSDIWVAAATISIGLRHFDGSAWAPAEPRIAETSYFYGLTLSLDDRLYAVGHAGVGKGGLAAQFINDAWAMLTAPPADPLRAAWSFSDGRLLTAGDDGALFEHGGLGWSSPGSVTRAAIHDIFRAPDGTTMRAVGDGGVILRRTTGGSWEVEESSLTNQPLYALWGASESDLYAVGANNTLLHFDGTSWKAQNGPSADPTSTLSAIWGSGASDIWIVDTKHANSVFHHDGSKWALQAIDSRYVYEAVWGTGPSDVWVVGNYNVTCHYNGAIWGCEQQSINAGDSLHAIHGRASGPIIAVGNGGDIVVHENNTWSSLKSPDPQSRILTDVTLVSPTEAWAVGESGLVLHFNLSGWEISDAATGRNLNVVEWLENDSVFIGGNRGAILRRPLNP